MQSRSFYPLPKSQYGVKTEIVFHTIHNKIYVHVYVYMFRLGRMPSMCLLFDILLFFGPYK